jgi:hypothetical protein
VKDQPKPSRATVLHTLIEEIPARNDGHIPTNIEGTDTYFDNVEVLANALLLRWHTRLVASLERSLVDDPEDRREAVIEAWRHAARIYSAYAVSSTSLQRTHPPTSSPTPYWQPPATTGLPWLWQPDWPAVSTRQELGSATSSNSRRVGATSRSRARPASL